MPKRACGDLLKYKYPHCRCLKWSLFLTYHHWKFLSRHCSRNIKMLGAVPEWPQGGKSNVACLACEGWKCGVFSHPWGKASLQSPRRDGEREGEQPWEMRQILNNLVLKPGNHSTMISDPISSLLRCPLRVHHCLDYCQDLLFRCWVSLCSQLSFLFKSALLYGQGKPCSLSNPKPSTSPLP